MAQSRTLRSDGQGRLDVGALFATLDATRQARGKRWWHVAEEAGVSQSTLTRLGNGHRPDIDGALALCRWLGMPLERFERDADGESVVAPAPVAELVALLRADRRLSDEGREMLVRMIQSAYADTKTS